MSLGFIPHRPGQLRFTPLKTRALPRCGAGLCLAGLCLASPLAGAFDSGSSDTLTDVIVTSTKIETPAQYSTQSVTVITEEEIKEKNYTDTTEILRQTAGIQFKQAGGPGQFNYPKLRGFEPPRLSRRLQLLRGWGHEDIDKFFTGSQGASGSHGARASGRA